MTKNAIGTDRKTLQSTTNEPSWCVGHEHLLGDHPDDEATRHAGQEVTVSAMESTHSVQLYRYDFSRPGPALRDDSPMVIVDGQVHTPAEALAFGKALAAAAQAAIDSLEPTGAAY